MTLNLELNKTYITHGFDPVKGPSGQNIRKIKGHVIPGTYEHKNGLRFFDDHGSLFDEHGGSFKMYLDDEPMISLIREAEVSDLSRGYFETYRVPYKDVSDPTKYAQQGQPEYVMKIGNLYANRMGYPALIDKLFSCVCDDPTCEQITFLSADGKIFDGKGKILKKTGGLVTMLDLAYMKLT